MYQSCIRYTQHSIKIGIFGQPELFDPKLMQLNFDPGNFRIEIFMNIRDGQKDEFGGQPAELVLLTAPNIREYFYTKIRFSTPALSALFPLASQICLS